jgi:integrase
MGKLNALQVKNAKPGRHSDGKGLLLLVKPSGAKSWILRAQADGKRRDFGLGPVDLVSLQEAREKALEGRKMLRAGFDPSVEWKRSRRVLPTFEAAARHYHENVKAGWKNGKHNAQWITTLETYAFPLIGKETVDRVEASHIESVLQPIWMTVPETARRVRQRIGSVLDYAHGQGWRATEAPMRAVQSLMKGLKQPKKGNFAAMPYSELPSFVKRLREAGPSIGRSALEFLILTAARSGEVRGALWGEIDWEMAQWNIPAERMKMGEPHSVPLTSRALAILKEMQAHSRGPCPT